MMNERDAIAENNGQKPRAILGSLLLDGSVYSYLFSGYTGVAINQLLFDKRE